ncbi:plasmid pRiA4b ORF-3 family protein [Thomasclavelia cocleata]|uniref:IS1096 element passenger TnpR family protein n=1 Tax=Thomasclavelia cocleata TaxID=69824 RepID=UPI0024321474|nr:plasmid pRiA4b ORF-3 family protein [Thomasclavelia cocleata]
MEGYQLKVFVQGSTEPIWRIVKVPVKMTFMDLHLTIQKIFELSGEDTFYFELQEIGISVIKLDIIGDVSSKLKTIFCNEIIDDYFYEGMVCDYFYDLEDRWEFGIIVEKKLDDYDVVPKVTDYFGGNLLEDCGGISGYEKIINEIDDELISFDLDYVNECLRDFEVEQVINNDLIKEDFILVLNKLKEIIKKRNIESYQVIKLNGTMTIYWVIIKTIEGYVVELFQSYDDLLQGFYNLRSESINYAFCYCYTFLLSNSAMELEQTLNSKQTIGAFFNEPGYLSSLINLEDGPLLLNWLEELLIGLTFDNNISEADEIIDINIKNKKFESSSIYVHEPEINISEFDFGYSSKVKLNSSLKLFDRVCVDVICLPTLDTYITNELQMYAVIATEEDYLLKEIIFPDKIFMSEALVDVMVDFFRENGIPKYVVINNLNVLFLVFNFLNENEIGYIEDDTNYEIDLAIADAFGFDNEMIDNSFLQELIEEFRENEEEIETKLDEFLVQNELLN